MAKLNSYSCSKCGGILNFDEGMELFACPFCGNEFGVVDLHRGEIIGQAEAALRRRKFDTARDIYKTLLAKNPQDFEALLGMILVAGKLLSAESLDDIEKVKSCDFKAARASLRAAQKAASETEYFNRLSELLKLAEEYKNAKLERSEATQEARDKFQNIVDMEVRIEEDKERQNEIIKIVFDKVFPFAAWVLMFVLAFFITRYDDGEGVSPFLVLVPIVVVPLLFFIIRYFYFEAKKKELAVPDKRDIVSGHKNAEKLSLKAQKLKDDYNIKLEELKKLDPTVNGYTPPAPAKVDAGPDPFVDVTKTVTCAKCGGQLFLDKEKKLYECKFCGVGYGTSLFFNEPLAKANLALSTSDFTEADQRFMHMLMVDPHDHEALLGRILAAGKWKDIHDIDLEDKMLPFMEAHLTERTDEAVQHSSEEHKKFFDDMKRIVEIYIQWAHAEQKLKSAKNGIDYVNNNSRIDMGYKQPVYKNITTKEEDDDVFKKDELKVQLDSCMIEKKKLREEFTPLKNELEKDKLRLSAGGSSDGTAL